MRTKIETAVSAVKTNLETNGFDSYDYYDLWSAPLGRALKQMAYKTEPFGNFLFAAPILAIEWWAPWLKSALRIKKKLYPICVAHYGLTCLELHKNSPSADLISQAEGAAELLMRIANEPGIGLSWGFPYYWSMNKGVVPPNQPASTQTGYVFDLLEELWTVTKDAKYREALLETVKAMDQEYADVRKVDGIASTYHGRGYGDIVMNAITYRIHILAKAMQYGYAGIEHKISGLVEYALSQQQDDGSWLYGESPKNQFIDHFHTCFVIKNLTKANHVLKNPAIERAVDKGIEYYWSNLFDDQGLPRPFAQKVRSNFIKFESYDFAECLGLFALFGPEKGFNAERLNKVLEAFFDLFWIAPDRVRFRVYTIPTVKGPSYYRFGMTAAMFSLAQLINSTMTQKGCSALVANRL